MSKTKKKLFYSAIVAVAILLAFVAATFMTASEGASVISEVGEGQNVLSTTTVNPSTDSGYNELGVVSNVNYPGYLSENDRITSAHVSDAEPITTASGLEGALKTDGKYYLLSNITITASANSSSAAAGGTFRGVLYGNGYTVTIKVNDGTKYSHNGDGTYGFLVKSLEGGTIRDLNVVIEGGNTDWNKFGFNTGQASEQSQPDGETAFTQKIGGIAGNMTGGLIHNCSVKYSGYLWLISNASVPATSSAWSKNNMANIFGGVAGSASGGVISYTSVEYDGKVVNTGQQRGDGTNHLMISTGGFVGQIGNGTVYMRKVTLKGGGWLASEAHTYSRAPLNYPYTDVLTGGLVGWISSASGAGLQANGVYLNMTYFSQGADSGAYSGSTASSGNAGGVKSYYASAGGVNQPAFKSASDSIANDQGGNINSDAYASELRTSYGIGAVHQSKTSSISLNNVYVSSAMNDIIQKHHPYAAHQIYYGKDTSNTYWDRWNWLYTVVDSSTLGTEFAFAPTSALKGTYAYNSNTTFNDSNNQRGFYLKVSNQSEKRFVYNIVQGTESLKDVYQIYSKTYNNFGIGGTVYVPVMYAGYCGNVESEVKGYNVLTDTSSSAVTTYRNSVSAEFGSYLYMDFDMSKGYDGADRYADGYQGSGNNYTYTYNGDRLYVPAFAGYKTSYGSGEKVNFSEDELNSLGMSSTHFSLSSTYTIVNSGTVNYQHYNYLHWDGAGNVGTYNMTFNKSSSDTRFISKDGANYYCAFMESYPTKTVEVVPYNLELSWNEEGFVYDGTGKDITASFAALPSGNGLNNNDSAQLGLAISYTADNPALMVQNKPYHAGDYKAIATLTYGGTTESAKTGNFLLNLSEKTFTVGKAQIRVTPEDTVSRYGDDHASLLAGTKITVSGNWVGDDESWFTFVAKTVDDTINFATLKGEYPTTVEASLNEGATAELLGDYEFVVTNGKLVINERPINGTLTVNGGVYNGSEYVAALSLDEGVRVSTDTVYSLDYVLGSDPVSIVRNAGEYLVRITPEENKYSIGTIIVNGMDELYVYGETKLIVEQRSVDVTLSFANGYVYDGSNKVTEVTIQPQEGDAGVLNGEDALLSMSYNGESEAVMPASYNASATFGNTNYKAGTVNGQTFTIERAELADIRIDDVSAVYDGTEKNIGYTLIGVADEENIASLVGEITVTYNKSTAAPVNAGEYSVEISVAEGTAYKSKTATATFTLNKAQITFNPVTSTVYTGRNIDPEYSITAPGMEDASSLKNLVSVTHTVIFNASTYDITLKFAGTANYEAKNEVYQLEVKRADLVLDLEDNQVMTYNGKAQAPVYGITAAVEGDEYGAVTLTFGGSKVIDNQAINAAEDYTLTVDIAESTNYNAVSKTVNFRIEKYVLGFIGATEQFVTVIKDGETQVTEINRYLPTMDFALVDDTGVYGIGDLNYVTKVNGSEATDIVFSDGKGTFTVEITVNGIDAENYDFAGVTITVNVLDAHITIVVNGEETSITSITFGDELTVEAKGNYGDSPEEDVQSVIWYAKGESGDYDAELGGAPVDAGEYMAMFRYTFGPDSNYVTRALYLTIAPKAVTVTLDGTGVNIVYGDDITAESFGGVTYTTDAGNIALTLEYSTAAEKYSPVGNYTLDGIITGVTDGNIANYAFTVVPGTFKIVKKTVYVKADDISAVYGEEVILSGFKVYSDDGITEWTDYEGADKLKVSLSVQDGILTVGGHEINVTAQIGENANYNVVAATEKGMLTISKRSIEITANDVFVVYGSDTLPEIAGNITGGTLVNGDTLDAITAEWKWAEALGVLDADTYTLSDYVNLAASLNSEQEGINYEITFSDTTKLVVSPRKVSIVFLGWQSADGMLGTENTVVYNAGVWTPSATIDGLLNGDVAEVVCKDSQEIKNAGRYSRTLALDGTDAANYVADEYVATLEIVPYKTEISVDANEYVYTYGDVKTAITQSIRVLDGDSDGGSFVQKYFVGTNTGVTGTQVNWDDVWNAGTYTVVVSYNGSNYTADPVNITVTVNKKKIDKVDPKNGGQLGSSVYNATNVSIGVDNVVDLAGFAGIEDFLYVVYRTGDTQASVVRNAGEYTIDLRMAENNNYEINGGGESLLNYFATYTITKASASELGFSLTYANKVFNGNDMSDYIKSVIAISGVGGEPVTGATLTLTVTDESGQQASPLNSGVYRISVTATGMNNYDDMTVATEVGNFTIDKVYVAIDAITFPDKTVTYDSTKHALTVGGLQESAVLKNVSYEYASDDYIDAEGAVNAGVYNVTVTVLFDKLNTRFSDDVSLESYTDEQYGEVYKYQTGATLTVNAAVPTVNIDKDTLGAYFNGYNRSIEFTLAGVGADSSSVASYNATMGAGNVIVVDGLGTFTVTYYTDAAYSNLLKDGNGAAALPITVLSDGGKALPYYLLISFKSENSNYADTEYKNNGYDMALYIMQAVVNLSFGSLSVPYGQLGSRAAANEYIKQNMKYTYTVNDEGGESVNYDPEAMLEISYNLTSFDVNTGSYEIAVNAVAAKTEFAGSVTAVVKDAGKIKLNITAAEVTDDMKAAFTSVSDTYGNKTYTAQDFNWTVKGIMNEDVAYALTYKGATDFSISDAGEYQLEVSIAEGNYKAWTGSVTLSISKVGVDVVWTMGGEAPVDGVFTKTYDGKPAGIILTVQDADGVTADAVYVNSEGEEIEAPYAVGTHRAKAVLSNDNYYVNEDCLYITVVIEAIVLDEDTIKGWISDDSDVYGSVQGIDITGLPEGYGAISIVYVNGDKVYDMTSVKNAVAGVYTATVTVSNGNSSGSATFTYTVEKRKMVFTVDLSAKEGVRPAAANATLRTDIGFAEGDSAAVSGLKFTSAYNEQLAFGVYDMKDYVAEVTVVFNKNADCYDYTVVMGSFTLSPAQAPVVTETTVNYNTATLTLDKEGLYAYRVGTRGQWVQMSSPSDTLIVTGLKGETSYTVYVAYVGFTSVSSTKSLTTTADPAKLSQMIDDIMEGGLTLEKKEQYESILAYYEKIATSDRPEIQAEYDALVAQFNALDGNGGGDVGNNVNAAVIAVCAVCLVLIIASVAGVVVAAVLRKRRNDNMFKIDNSLV